MRMIIYPNPDSPYNVVVVYPARRDLLRPLDDTDDACVQRAVDKLPTGVVYRVIDDSLLPSDPTYFDAWEWSSDGVGLNEGRVAEINLAMREGREPFWRM